MKRRRAFVCSPYRANTKKQRNLNESYAEQACLHSIRNGESPIAPHLHFTRFLDDDNDAQRAQGIECGSEWLAQADVVALYVDLGISEGMAAEKALAESLEIPVELRTLKGGVP